MHLVAEHRHARRRLNQPLTSAFLDGDATRHIGRAEDCQRKLVIQQIECLPGSDQPTTRNRAVTGAGCVARRKQVVKLQPESMHNLLDRAAVPATHQDPTVITDANGECGWVLAAVCGAARAPPISAVLAKAIPFEARKDVVYRAHSAPTSARKRFTSPRSLKARTWPHRPAK